MKSLIRSAVLLFAIFLSSALFAQDITGEYNLSASENPGGSNCTWAGQLTLTQSGGNPGTFVGTATANVVSGPCLNFSGSVSGNVDGSTLDFGVGVGGGGSISFGGSVVAGNLSGNWTGLGQTGIWSASPVAAPAPGGSTVIPTMSTYGLILTILGLLLVAARRLRASAKRS